MAISIASEPPGQKRERHSPAGVISASFFARLMADDIGIAPGAKRHAFIQLRLHGVNDGRIVKPGVMNAVAVHVDIFFTVHILDVYALRTGKYI